MVLDTSALIAMLTGEPDGDAMFDAIANDEARLVSTATLLETSIVLSSRRGPAAIEELTAFLALIDADVRTFDEAQLEHARRGFVQYGKGRHRAGLNFGDCFAYALARVSDEPLLYKGNDFSQTDIDSVLAT